MIHSFKIPLALVLMLTLPLTAPARLEETEKESEARYGKPVEDKYPTLEGATNRTYNYKGWRIRAGFLNGKTVRIVYSKLTSPEASSIISNDEGLAILEGEKGGGQWKARSTASSNPTATLENTLKYTSAWTNTAGSVAYFDMVRQHMTLETPDAEAFRKKLAEEKLKQQKAKIPKF